MEDNQTEHVSMFIKVKTFLNKKTSELAATPVVSATLKPVLIAKIDAILEEEEDASSPITGSTELKRELRTEVENRGFDVAAACAAYYTITSPNPRQRVKCQFVRSDLNSNLMRDNDLYVRISKVHKIADPIKALLSDFGISSADVDDLETSLTDFFAEITGPKDAIGERSASGKQVDRLINQTNEFLDEQLDVVMKHYRNNNPELYDYYLNARKIDSTGGGPIPDEDEEMTIGVGDYLPGVYPPEINAESRIRVLSKPTNTQNIAIGFSSVENGFSGINESLAPGADLDKTAAELGFNPGIPYFYFHNPATPGAIAAVVRIKVYF